MTGGWEITFPFWLRHTWIKGQDKGDTVLTAILAVTLCLDINGYVWGCQVNSSCNAKPVKHNFQSVAAITGGQSRGNTKSKQHFMYYVETYRPVGWTYRVMVDDHAVQQGANCIETAHVQTCELENTFKVCTYWAILKISSDQFPKQSAASNWGGAKFLKEI